MSRLSNDDLRMLSVHLEMDRKHQAPHSRVPSTPSVGAAVSPSSAHSYHVPADATVTTTTTVTPQRGMKAYCDCIACQDIVGDHTNSTKWQTATRWFRKFNRSFLGELAKFCVTLLVAILVGYYAVKSQIDGLKTQVTDLQIQTTALSTQTGNLQSSVEGANRNLVEAQNTISNLQGQLQSLGASANKTSATLASIDIYTLQQQASNISFSLTVLNNQSTTTAKQIESASAQLSLFTGSAFTQLNQLNSSIVSAVQSAALRADQALATQISSHNISIANQLSSTLSKVTQLVTPLLRPTVETYVSYEANIGESNASYTRTDFPIPFNTIRYNSGNGWDIVNQRFAPNVSGSYLITANVLIRSNAGVDSHRIDILKNGTVVHSGPLFVHPDRPLISEASTSAVVALADGEYLEICTWSVNTGNGVTWVQPTSSPSLLASLKTYAIFQRLLN